jgi:hypothetical protein
LKPSDGAIGFYYLGVSYHLPGFEIADFLGKADEMIATSAVRWGPPGHNKWDTNKTVKKWNLQAIVPSGNADFNIIANVDNAKKALAGKRDFGFAPDLLVNDNINEKYAYCYLKSDGNKTQDKWGFFLRKDLAIKHQSNIKCN